MGVCACPIADRGFEGKIFLKRVSEEQLTKKAFFSEDFADHVAINESVKSQWRRSLNETMTIGEMIVQIVREFEINEDVIPKLAIRYQSTARTTGKKSWFDLKCTDKVCAKK